MEEMEVDDPLTPNDTKPFKNDVVVLDDDDDVDVIDLVANEMRGDSKCINYACKSGKEMLKAPLFCLSYYRVKKKNKSACYICKECYNDALYCYDRMADALIKGDSLMDVTIPFRNDLVEIDDSDDDNVDVDMDQEHLSNTDIKFLNENFHEILQHSLEKYNVMKQTEVTVDVLLKNAAKTRDNIEEISTVLTGLRKDLDSMYLGLYGQFKTSYKYLPSIDISDPFKSQMANSNSYRIKNKPATNVAGASPNAGADESKKTEIIVIEEPPDLPPKGPLQKPPLKIDETYYAVRHLTMGSWIRVKLCEIIPTGGSLNGTLCVTTTYAVVQETMKQNQNFKRRYITGKEIAYAHPSSVLLDVGTRIIAVFRENGMGDTRKGKKDIFYPGIVAETLSAYNKYRYLIFFDDGYASYVPHNLVYLIYEASKDVWEDVNIGSRAFIQKYLQNYPNRPMVKLQKDQSVRTEYNGKWWVTTVMNIDCSLVYMYFENSNRVEWIYRGSTRLSTLFKEEQAATSRLQYKQRTPRALTSNVTSAPYVQYTREDTETVPAEQAPIRAVAKKSTARPNEPVTVVSVPQKVIERKDLSKSKIVYYTPKRQKPNTLVYRTHTCSVACQEYMTCSLKRLVSYNPLAKPLLCGFNRLLYKWRHRKHIVYKAPCGRTLRNMHELHQYLKITGSSLTVDYFNFEMQIRCLAEFIIDDNQPLTKDLSCGQEEVPIQVVNYVDNEVNEFVNYSTKREPMEGVNLNLDPEFLCGCDCTDDCSDKSKCACWQLTLHGMKYMPKETDPDTVGYMYRRLYEPVHTGIYECNKKCKCASTCLNRVVQNPLQHKLQVFKTVHRGWGIRCINDIPQGAFICIYAGALLTDQMANEGGQCYGDEYLAELDYIEVVEKMKEDYEAEVLEDEKYVQGKDPSESESEASVHSEEDDSDAEANKRKFTDYEIDRDFIANVKADSSNSSIRTRLRKRNVEDDEKKVKEANENDDPDTVTISDDEDDVREPSSFFPKTEPADLDESLKDNNSVRLLFGADENVYIMDAKNTGNIGRFLNHSCTPNVFVQNVFVDTHDLRFPWVAFFAMSYIRAGTELTWNYNYDVGSVPGKVLYCRCESNECKGRLL